MVQLYSRVSRSLALPISKMPSFIIPLADKLDSSICGMSATFTRNSTATYIDKDGVLQTAAINVPRFQNGRYLCESAATNLFLQSGTPATQVITVVSGTVYTVQCYGSGSITLSGAGTGSVVEGTPITFTASSTSLICAVSGSINRAQVETGTQETSYIPTTTAPVTRAADSLHYPVEDAITQGQGSLYCEFYYTFSDYIRKIVNLSNGTLSERLVVYITALNGLQVIGVTGGVTTINTPTVAYVASGINKALLTYDDNNVVLYHNGVVAGGDNTGLISTLFTKLHVGVGQNDLSQLNSEIGNVKYFKEVLTPAEAIKLTTV